MGKAKPERCLCKFAKSAPNVVYAAANQYEGELHRSNDGGLYATANARDVSESGGWHKSNGRPKIARSISASAKPCTAARPFICLWSNRDSPQPTLPLL